MLNIINMAFQQIYYILLIIKLFASKIIGTIVDK
jgi:hypothetical protein